jgi:hypothetical protein
MAAIVKGQGVATTHARLGAGAEGSDAGDRRMPVNLFTRGTHLFDSGEVDMIAYR